MYVHGSNIVLKGETVFANNTADYGGGTTVKFTLSLAYFHDRKKLFTKNNLVF